MEYHAPQDKINAIIHRFSVEHGLKVEPTNAGDDNFRIVSCSCPYFEGDQRLGWDEDITEELHHMLEYEQEHDETLVYDVLESEEDSPTVLVSLKWKK